MRALYWDGHGLTLHSAHPAPDPSSSKTEGASDGRSVSGDSREALIKVHLAGVCATDLQIFKGYMGFRGVPGHEFVGTVLEGPSGFVGQRVVGEINFGCGECDACRRDLSRHCSKRKVMGILNADGAFAEFVSMPGSNLHLVPEKVSDEEAVFTEPLAAAFEILTQIPFDPGDEVLILGDGKLGNLCAQAVRLSGAKLTVWESTPTSLL